VKTRWTGSLVAGVAVLLSGSLGTSAAEPNAGQNQSPMQWSARVTQISNLMGTMVVAPKGQRVGQIKDVLLDSQTGRATFVVLDAEGPGSGHAMLVVPYRALRVSYKPVVYLQDVVLDLRSDRLYAAPQIQNNQWQMLQNPQFPEQVQSFYEPRTYTAAHPIGNTMSPLPPSQSAPCQPALPPSCTNSADPWSGWPQDSIDFYNE
jgi:sporulation protein YlmC with PRC-barrel domain